MKGWTLPLVAVFAAVNALAGGAWICRSLGDSVALWGLFGLGSLGGFWMAVAIGLAGLARRSSRKSGGLEKLRDGAGMHNPCWPLSRRSFSSRLEWRRGRWN